MPPANRTFHPDLVRKLVKDKKMTNEAALAAAELMRLVVVEARCRASIEADCERESEGAAVATVRPAHFTKVAADLLLDF